jgi:uncharacterized protein (TIGR03067 family)
MVEDGAVIPDEMIKKRFAVDGRFTVAGQSISFIAPATQEKRTILFATDDKTSPKSFDLAGTDKVSSKGIYMLLDDVLMLCLGEADVKERPTTFAAKQGSGRILLTLHRTKPDAYRPPPPPIKDEPKTPPVKDEPKTPPVPAGKLDNLRDQLFGTWGHQDDDWLHLVTFNRDGTFSATRTYRHRFGKIFHENVRSSGTWKVQENVVILTISASTDKDLLNQISSYRVRSISATEVISVDQFGRLRRDWKTK